MNSWPEEGEGPGLDENDGGDAGATVIREGPAGMDDPDTEWDAPDLEDPLLELSSDEFVLLEPGEDPEVWPQLPKERNFGFGIAARTGQLVVCDGRRRIWLRTGNGTAPDHTDAPIAARMIVVFIAHRDRGRRTKPKEYLVIIDSLGGLLGWLDYSDRWSFSTRVLRQIATAGNLAFEVERFNTESEFELAHPDWIG